MSTRLLVLVCLLAACGCGSSQGLQVANSGNTTPVTQPPAAQPRVGRLEAIAFSDQSHGWAAGKGAIIATADGGASWSGQYRGGADIRALEFSDHLHGWAVATDSLLRTSDGGATWSTAAEPAGLTLTQVDFVTADQGWGVAQPAAGVGAPVPGTLVRSDDGGASWSVVKARAADSVCVSGGLLIAGSGSRVLSSADNGSSWTTLLDAASPQPGWLTATVRCSGPGSIWVLFEGDSGAGSQAYLAYFSGDAGRAWQPVLSSPVTLVFGSNAHRVATLDSLPGPFDAVSTATAVFLGQCPACAPQRVTVLGTADGGGSWQRHLITGFAPTGLDMVDAGHGWMTALIGGQEGRRSAILATADGGRSWHPVFPK
jgi:photosystem II stability/assembly factor-like uncharacterized protein